MSGGSAVPGWDALTRQQIGKYAEYLVKMRLTQTGFQVYGTEVDDRGIDFVLRRDPGLYWDVQVKSVRRKGYVFFQKEKFTIRPNLLVALVIFPTAGEPGIYLIPAARWLKPDGFFVDRDYEAAASKPEFGLNLSPKNIPALAGFEMGLMTRQLMTTSEGAAAIPLAVSAVFDAIGAEHGDLGKDEPSNASAPIVPAVSKRRSGR